MSVLLTVLLAAGAYDDTFERATEAYRAGEYTVASASLEQLVDQGVVDASVFFNLGNVYYRQGLLASAIASYERALQVEPGMPEAIENLNASIRQTQRSLSKPHPPDWEQSLLFWHYNLRRETSLWVGVVFWFALWGILALRQFRPYPFTRRAAIVAAVGALLFGASWWAKSTPTPLAVAASHRAPVHFGMSENEAVRFELYEGDRVAVDRREAGWARVETAGGERGWTREDHLLFVGPPYEPLRGAESDQLAAPSSLGYLD